MVRSSVYALLILLSAVAALAIEPPPFPPNTSVFYSAGAGAAVPAQGGGIWVSLAEGIVRFTANERGAVLTVPGGQPRSLAAASDGTIWYSSPTAIGRISTSGEILEQYAIANAGRLAVATDGALWYLRSNVVGRIAGGAVVEFPAPTTFWSIAPAPDGGVWLLPNGLGTDTDVLHRMSAGGALTFLPLHEDVLFGALQALPDGTLYVGAGYRNGLLRLRPPFDAFERVSDFTDERFIVDDLQDIWSTKSSRLNFRDHSGAPPLTIQLPYDPRLVECSINIPAYAYQPLTIDSDGGLWLRIFDDAWYIGEPIGVCELPEPPPMPTLIRLDTAAVLSAQVREIPTLSATILLMLGAAIAALGVSRLRS